MTAEAAQRWCNEYLSGIFRRAKGEDATAYRRSPQTLHGRVRKLKAIWNKYVVKRLKLVATNRGPRWACR